MKYKNKIKMSSPKNNKEDLQHSGTKKNKEFSMQTSGVYANVEKQINTSAVKKSQIIQKEISGNTKQKMIDQNMKLKRQIYELALHMEEIMGKEKKQKKFGMHEDEDDEIVQKRKMELKKQQIEIMQIKNQIFLTQRQLDHVYDSKGIQGKEDELRALKKQIRNLENEKDGLLKVRKQQYRALSLIKSDDEYQEKIHNMKDQLSKIKEECKILTQKLTQNERKLRKNHEQYIGKQTKIKQVSQKIEENRKKAKKGIDHVVTVEMIGEIEEQINELEKERRDSEKSWNEKIQNIDNELHQRKLEEEKKLLILKQKDKELKLNQIRIKELHKLIQHQNAELQANKKQTQETDMKEFRHRRNIKYLEK